MSASCLDISRSASQVDTARYIGVAGHDVDTRTTSRSENTTAASSETGDSNVKTQEVPFSFNGHSVALRISADGKMHDDSPLASFSEGAYSEVTQQPSELQQRRVARGQMIEMNPFNKFRNPDGQFGLRPALTSAERALEQARTKGNSAYNQRKKAISNCGDALLDAVITTAQAVAPVGNYDNMQKARESMDSHYVTAAEAMLKAAKGISDDNKAWNNIEIAQKNLGEVQHLYKIKAAAAAKQAAFDSKIPSFVTSSIAPPLTEKSPLLSRAPNYGATNFS